MKFNIEDIKEYVEKNKVFNNDIKKSIDIVKNKIKTDRNITNKKEVSDILDNVHFLIDKKDIMSKNLFKQASDDSKIDPKCFVVFFKDLNPIIVLSKDYELDDITHELNHVVEKYMKKNMINIKRLFNFNYDFKTYSKIYGLLTNGKYLLTKEVDKKTLNYLKEPSEIYARIDNLKHFLYEHRIISNPNQDINRKITYKLFSGEIFNELNDEDKLKFANSDFMQVLMFFDVKKYPEINKLLKNINENTDPIGAYPIDKGPINNFDIRYNPPNFSTNIATNKFDTINGLNTEYIEDDYFKSPNRKKKRKKKRKIKKFKDFKNEGAGFGSVDYRNVTGDATSSGYLNDNQPMGNNNSATIASDLPRGNWHQPTTVIIGFKDYIMKDPYFLNKKKKKKKVRKTFRDDIRDKKSKKLNKKYKKELPKN